MDIPIDFIFEEMGDADTLLSIGIIMLDIPKVALSIIIIY